MYCTNGIQEVMRQCPFLHQKWVFFNQRLLNNLSIELLTYYRRVLLKPVKESIFELHYFSC